jgi:ABC-2 type transport system permease protein
MKNSLLIAVREWKARVGSRFFLLMSVIGPSLILTLIYILFAFGGEGKQKWKVLVTDKAGLLEHKIITDDDKAINYYFADDYIEIEDFRDGKRYQEFDAMVEVNEKVLSNKVGHIFYRELPSTRMQTRVQYQIERRIEEIMVGEFTDFSINDYLKIKQALNLSFHNVYDPRDEASDLSGWVGFFYGTLIFSFIFLFGMTILRSVTYEKSNRIVEVLLASVSPRQLMSGKIMGIGFAAIIQFVVWIVVIGFGLFFMRELLFPDMLDPANMNFDQFAIEASQKSYADKYYANLEYNQFVELVYERVNFGVILPFFVLFFIAGYLFYGALFAAIGATMGTESDGQQFVIPLVLLLFLSLYAGYFAMNHPESNLTSILQYVPFTSPVVVMVKLAQGYEPGHGYEVYLALLTLLLSAFFVLGIASRLYKNGILQFGHRLRLRHILKWLRST